MTDILENFGWLGYKEVGWNGSQAIFLVIQHATLPVQEKYLPMMREAARSDHLEQRRASVGLGTLAEYGRHFGIVWDAAAIEKNRNLAPQPAVKR